MALLALGPDFRQDDGVGDEGEAWVMKPVLIDLEHALARDTTPSLFSRDGGSPVWIPAFAGKQAYLLEVPDDPASGDEARAVASG
jgi:hypothetical protein